MGGAALELNILTATELQGLLLSLNGGKEGRYMDVKDVYNRPKPQIAARQVPGVSVAFALNLGTASNAEADGDCDASVVRGAFLVCLDTSSGEIEASIRETRYCDVPATRGPSRGA